jgi:RND family efflux transporter MFP subunit
MIPRTTLIVALLISAALILAGCSRSTQPDATAVAQDSPERRTESATLWSGKTELFVEYPALVRGEESRFAIHLTRLSDFKPVTAGRSEVLLTYPDGKSEAFSADAPSRPGIFGVTVRPSATGEVKVQIRLASPALTDEHTLDRVPVYSSIAEAPTGEEPATEETLSFLKEQQWALDFGTELAKPAMLRESLVVPAEVTPRSGGEVAVTAPLAGRLTGESFPGVGTRVSQGQVLGAVIPPTSVPNDRASLDLAKAEAEAALDFARRDRERAARLVDAGAAPAKRLDEARTAERTAEARVRAAEERIRQFDASRTAEGAGGSAPFAIRSPITGTVIEMAASPGMNLKGGETLFRIVDTERVYVSAIVPEADYPSIRQLNGAEIEIPGMSQPRPVGRLVTVGKIVDPATRTFPVVYEATNADGRIAINQTVTIRLFLSAASQGTTLPESALVDDGGRPVVFIQREGEAFVRRPVTIGRRQGGLAEITSGIEPGDRVVTRGAYLVRLSALSTQIPAHGHVH